MILLNGQSLTPARKLMPEALGLSLEERRSTATMELGPADPEIPVGSWLLDDEPGTGEGIVWRTRSADNNFNTETRNITLEHIISTLQDDVLFGEHTWEDIAGAGASDCSAKQAAEYILARQSLWVLGDFEFTERWPYKFNGDSLFSALQTVTASCPDAYWEYDLSQIPFRLHVRRISDETTCEMRPGRNIRTIKRVIDRTGMYTRHYPIGKDDLHITGDYISKNEAIYGKVCKIETYSGAETEDALRSWAWERLNRHCEPKVTVTIGGLELSEATGESLDRLTLNRRCRVPLPEFGTTIAERIIRIRVTDKVRKKEEVTVTLGNEIPDLAAIVGDVEKEQASGRGGGGRGGMKQAGEDHAWFVDTDEHVGMVAEAIIGHGPDGVDWSRVAEVIVDGGGIHNRVTRAEGYMVVLEAKIDLTEEKLRAEFADVTASLRSELEMSAASLRVEFENLNNSTRSELQITSESLRTEFTNEINSTRSELQITSESLRSTITNTAEGLQSQIDQTAEAVSLKVSKGNVATQLSVECGNVSVTGGNLTVEGMVTADAVQSAIANITALEVVGLNASGVIKSTSGVQAPDFNLTGGGALSNAVQQIFDGVADGGRVTFTYSHFAGQNGTFSFNIADTQYYQDGVAAVTIRSASWSSRDIQATLSNGRTILPAANLRVASGYPGYSANNAATMALISGEKKKGTVDVTLAFTDPSAGSAVCGTTMPVYVNAGAAYSAGYADAAGTVYLDPATNQTPGYGRTVTVKAKYLDESGTAQDAASITVTTPADRAPTDAAVDSQKQGQTWYVNVDRADGGSQLLEVNMASVYAKAREGYTQGTFRLASVTTQGEGVSIQAIGSPVYFKSESITPISGSGYTVTTRTRYLRKTTGITALTGYTNYNSGSSITLYRRSTNAYGDVTYSSAGYYVWRHGGSTQTLYEANGSATDYDVGSGGAGKTLYEAGSAVTRYQKLNAGGSGISTYYNAKTAEDYYKKGATVTDTYYTKS